MSDDNEAFGPWLERELRDRGLSNRAAARLTGVSDVTISDYIRGYKDKRTNGGYTRTTVKLTVPVLAQLARGLGIEPAVLFGKAGLPVPQGLAAFRADAALLTNAELLSLLKDRLDAPTTHMELPPVELTDAQVRWRGRLIVRLETVADEAREIGDDSAAAALCDMAETFKANLEAATAAEISEAQAQRQPATGE